VSWALLVGSKPRGPGMERGDLLKDNGAIFVGQGRAIAENAAKDVRVAVVGNPCNTNCMIAMHSAPDVPKERFSAMTRLDQNRAQAQLALKAKVAVTAVKNTLIWGNHSATQVPDFQNTTIGGKPAHTVIGERAWLEGEFFKSVQQRGAAIITARGVSSAASAANALIDHVRDLCTATPKGEWRSVCVRSDGSYGVPAGLIFSFPVAADGQGGRSIVPGLALDAFLKQKLAASVAELEQEKAIVAHLLG
jgi:malate dehydrogenase